MPGGRQDLALPCRVFEKEASALAGAVCGTKRSRQAFFEVQLECVPGETAPQGRDLFSMQLTGLRQEPSPSETGWRTNASINRRITEVGF